MTTNTFFKTEDMSSLLELLTLKGKSGTGYFDVLMRSVHSHIQDEHTAGRIAPNEYAKAYVEVTNATLNGAIQYLIQAPNAMHQARLTEAQVELAEAELKIQQQALLIKTEEVNQSRLTSELLQAQIDKMVADKLNIEQSTKNLIQDEAQAVHETKASEHKAKAMEYRIDAEFAATRDTLADGSTSVAGTIGRDNAHKEAQSLSFRMRDMFQMINANQSSNTAQITTLSTVDIAPTHTTGASLDTAIAAYYSQLGISL